MNRNVTPWLLGASLAAMATAARAEEADAGAVVSEVIVVAPTPLSGGGVDPAKLPGVVESLGDQAFLRTGSLAVTDTLEQRVAGVALSDTQGNGFTRDLNFRGFQASPLQGTPQGLAVYLNGVRLNEAFGDSVNWDLVPEIAIARADLFTANPAFGLNALGGAVTLRGKSGFDTPGGGPILQAGSFGRVYGAAEQGWSSGPWGVYLAADGGHERGWRDHSPSDVARVFGDLGWKGGDAEAHLFALAADNRFGVVGPTPVDLLENDRDAVYTYPQKTRNKTLMVGLDGSKKLSEHWSAQASGYVRRFRQRHVDGNDGDFEGCSRQATNPLFNTLCLEDDSFPDAIRPPAAAFQVQTLTGTPIGCPPILAGQNRPCNGIPYGSVDRTRTRADTYGVAFQTTSDAPLMGRTNAFAAGVSLDHGRARFSSNSTLGLIQEDLLVDATPGSIPGVGQLIRTAGAVAYSPVEARTRTTYLGAYATDTWDVTGRLSLTLSARFNHAHVKVRDLTGASPEINGTHDFDRFNPAGGFAWRFAEGVSLYGGYAETNRAPTALELGCSDPARPCLLENALVSDPPLDQVVAKTLEAGLRGRSGPLKWRVGVFQADNTNDIVALASDIQGRGYFANVPKTRRRGAEASADYTRDTWQLYAAASHIAATYRFSGDLPSGSPFADDDGNVQVEPGDRIGAIPGWRLKLGGDWAVTPAVTLGADLVAVGPQRLAGDESNEDTRLRSYRIVGLHAEWRATRGVTLFARVDNLFDSRRATYGTYFEPDGVENAPNSPLDDDADTRTVSPLTPRAFAIGLRVRW